MVAPPARTLLRYRCERCSDLFSNPDELFVIDIITWEWNEETIGQPPHLVARHESPWLLCAKCVSKKTPTDNPKG